MTADGYVPNHSSIGYWATVTARPLSGKGL